MDGDELRFTFRLSVFFVLGVMRKSQRQSAGEFINLIILNLFQARPRNWAVLLDTFQEQGTHTNKFVSKNAL